MTDQDNRGLLVLIVAYRADDHLEQCLTAVGDGARVVVVDNDASERTRGIVTPAGGQYVATASNLGFAAAVNVGLAAAWDGVSDVLLLNPDARISIDDVRRLQVALRNSAADLGAVGPRLVDEAGCQQRADWPLPSPAQLWLEALGAARLWRGRRFVVGAVLLLRAEAVQQVGNLDERYFLYAEEADWQLRAQRAGWSVAVVNGVTAQHVGSASSSDPELRERLFHGSAETFARRWYGPRGWWLMRLAAIVAALRRSVVGSAGSRATSRRALRLYLRGPRKVADMTRRQLA
ncbi:MAG: hypothetical protein QOI42_1940 [Frankiaceae bacterium]|nr:hypothetical protein [Frankiaceae bacterium]